MLLTGFSIQLATRHTVNCNKDQGCLDSRWRIQLIKQLWIRFIGHLQMIRFGFGLELVKQENFCELCKYDKYDKTSEFEQVKVT